MQCRCAEDLEHSPNRRILASKKKRKSKKKANGIAQLATNASQANGSKAEDPAEEEEEDEEATETHVVCLMGSIKRCAFY